MQATYLTHTQVRDGAGNIVEESTEVEVNRRTNNEPEYVKLYIEQWLVTMSGKASILSDVLFALINIGLTFAGQSADGGMIVHASSYEKEAVARKLGCSLSSVNNTITKLVQLNALRRLQRGVYQVNPSLVGKGNWASIKALQVNWEFTPEGVTNTTYVTGEPKTITGDDTLVVL